MAADYVRARGRSAQAGVGRRAPGLPRAVTSESGVGPRGARERENGRGEEEEGPVGTRRHWETCLDQLEALLEPWETTGSSRNSTGSTGRQLGEHCEHSPGVSSGALGDNWKQQELNWEHWEELGEHWEHSPGVSSGALGYNWKHQELNWEHWEELGDNWESTGSTHLESVLEPWETTGSSRNPTGSNWETTGRALGALTPSVSPLLLGVLSAGLLLFSTCGVCVYVYIRSSLYVVLWRTRPQIDSLLSTSLTEQARRAAATRSAQGLRLLRRYSLALPA
ncbi:uncharacterized protein [Melanerpes formicivorus]|uniref:uncharacterized protein n=1 Tax=Melanerpes formicivorus TaxID=211600 RepID=UPI0035901D36